MSVQSDGGLPPLIISFRGRRQGGELISTAPAQPSLLAMMVAGLDDPEATAARAVRLGQHGQSDGFVNPPPYLYSVHVRTRKFKNPAKAKRYVVPAPRANSKTQGGTRSDSDSICHRHHSVFSGFQTV